MVSCRRLAMRLGFVTAHSDTPTLPRCPWRSQKYTVPVCAHCVPDSRHRHAQQRGRVPIPMSIGASELGRRKGPAPDLDRVCECEADRQGQAPTHVKLQPCSPVLHHHVAPCPLARLARHMGGPHRRQHWLHNSAYGKDVGGHVLQGTGSHRQVGGPVPAKASPRADMLGL